MQCCSCLTASMIFAGSSLPAPTGTGHVTASGIPSSPTNSDGAEDLTVLVDDQTLSALLREDQAWPDEEVFTTGCWYLRLCQAVVRGAGGALSGPLLSLPAPNRERALRSVLELPDAVQILNWRVVAPVMASQLESPGRGLNLLSREALAAAHILRARVVMARGNENRLLRSALRLISG